MMKLNNPQTHRSRSQGFSLSEVTMSVGLVSAVLLPVLGLLAAGTQLSNDSQDQAAASRIASAVTGGLRRDGTAGSDPVLVFADGIEAPLSSSGSQIYAGYSISGDFVRTVEPSEYSSGVLGDPDILYFAAIELTPVIPEAGSVLRVSPLLTLTIEIEFPANASDASRSVSRFVSRIGAP